MEDHNQEILSAKDTIYCEENLNEKKSNKESSIKEIQEWISTENDLGASADKFNVVRFLRVCKYNIEATKTRIKYYYTLRKNTPLWFKRRDPHLPEIQQLLNIGVFLPLLKRDSNGHLVVIIRVAAHDPKKHTLNDVFKVGLMILDWVLEKWKDTSIYGVIAVLDLKGISLGHARQLSLNTIRTAVHSWQDCYPARVRSLEFINTPPYVDVVLNLFRGFMKQKLKERVHVHKYNLESLHMQVQKDILPHEYGGSEGDVKQLADFWKNKVISEEMWYKNGEENIPS